MAKKQLNVKEQHYADTRDEAEEIVSEAKEDIYLMSHGIAEKHNKYGTYFLVDLKFNYDTPRDIMESGANDPPAEPVHDGIEYAIDNDGTASVVPGQTSLEDYDDEGDDE